MFCDSARGADIQAGPAEVAARLFKRSIKGCSHLLLSVHVPEDKGADAPDLVTCPHAPAAPHTEVIVALKIRPFFFYRLCFVNRDGIGMIKPNMFDQLLQFANLVFPAPQTFSRVILQYPAEGLTPEIGQPGCAGMHDHPFCRRRRAGSRQPAETVDLNRTQATGPKRFQGRVVA